MADALDRMRRWQEDLRQLHRLVRSRTDAKNAVRQWVEMAALFALHRNGPGYYQMAGFWRTGQTWSDMSRHMSYAQFTSQVDALNPASYRKLSQNKVAEKAILTLLGIPTPRFIGLFDGDRGRSASGASLRTAGDLARVLAADPAERVCFKLLEGHGGSGFIAVDVLRDGDVRVRPLGDARNPEAVSVQELMARLGTAPRVIEAYVVQHPAYAAFNQTSVNTLRIWVLRRGDRATTRLAFLRIGRRGSLVDNRSAGGIVAPIDLDTGRVLTGLDGTPRRTTYAEHPDTGARIEGTVLPLFAEATQLAEQCLSVFPGIHFAGIDVAVTLDGPVIIEANVQPARNGAAHVGIPTRDIFDGDGARTG